MKGLEGTVKLPGAGEVSKKTLALVGVGGGLLIFVYIRRQKSTASASTATDPTAIDPATGYAYGSPEDATALAGQSAYQNPTNYGGGGGPIDSGTTTNPITSNDEWARKASAFLVNHGARFDNVSTALSKYIAGEAVTPDEKTLIIQAIAYEGKPPVAGDAGYPPSIRETSAGTPKLRLMAPRIRLVNKDRNSAVLAWDRVQHADSYGVYKNGRHMRDVDTPRVDVGRPGQFYITAKGPGYYESKPSNFIQV